VAIAAYASTTREWFDFHVNMGKPEVAFWQPTPAKPLEATVGMRWYFKELHAPRLLGFGLYESWESMSPDDLFRRHGPKTGYPSEAEFLVALGKLARNGVIPSVVGNIMLTNFTTFNRPISVDSVGLADLNVRFAYLDNFDPIELSYAHVKDGAPVQSKFALVDEEQAIRQLKTAKQRSGQRQFRDMLLNLYGATCALSGPQPREVLQAAHIQVFVNEESNHPENGLLLRSDIHALFDLGIFSIDGNHVVHFNKDWISIHPQYGAYDDLPLKIPKTSEVVPSSVALKFHADNVAREFRAKRRPSSVHLPS
jgi:putative restriction endonuclease